MAQSAPTLPPNLVTSVTCQGPTERKEERFLKVVLCPPHTPLLHAGPSTIHKYIHTYIMKTITKHFRFCNIWKEYLKMKLFLISQTSKSLSVCLPGSPSPNHFLHSYATLVKLAFLWDFSQMQIHTFLDTSGMRNSK